MKNISLLTNKNNCVTIRTTMINYKELETDQQTRTENVRIRMTPVEKKRLFTEAQKLGISISAFVRLLLNSWHDGETTIAKR